VLNKKSKDQNNIERQQQELDNNPNFFYNEDVFVQQAMQQSLLESQPDRRKETEEDIFNNWVKDTIVQSRKEYDDIGRKLNEDEIQKIRNDPRAMKQKLENLFKKDVIKKGVNKLPPLEFSSGNTATKLKQKKTLAPLKAPVLTGGGLTSQRDSNLFSKDTNKNGNDTNSEIDINENQGFNNSSIAPSYNPQLLKDENYKDNVNLISLESNEFTDQEPKFTKANNDVTQKDLELNDLINELQEDKPKKAKQLVKRSQHNDRTLEPNYVDNQGLLPSRDSFEDLMDEFGDQSLEDKPPGMAKVEFVNKQIVGDGFGF